MRQTTRIAIALLVAVILALTIYAYPSLAGLGTLLFRAAAIVGALAIIALLIANYTKRRVNRLDVIIALSAVLLVGASWAQLSATADAGRLADEIDEAGETEIFAVLSTTETDTGELVRNGFAIRAAANAEIEAMLDALWTEDYLAALNGPAADDPDSIDAAATGIAAGRETLDDIRDDIEDRIDEEIEDFAALPTPLPDSARLVFVGAAIDTAEIDRIYYLQRLDQIAARLDAAEDAIALLADNPDGYAYDEAADAVIFNTGDGLGDITARHSVALTNIELSLDAENALVDQHDNAATRIATALDWVEAASATP